MNSNALKFALLTTLACLGLHTAQATLNDSNRPAKTVVAAAANLSINKASLAQLEEIPGIGAKKAQAILDYIKEHGPIKDQKQLTEVSGIGDKMAERIAKFVSFQ